MLHLEIDFMVFIPKKGKYKPVLRQKSLGDKTKQTKTQHHKLSSHAPPTTKINDDSKMSGKKRGQNVPTMSQ
jgi:hypothetical protein